MSHVLTQILQLSEKRFHLVLNRCREHNHLKNHTLLNLKITWICKAVEVMLVKFKHGCDLMIVTLLVRRWWKICHQTLTFTTDILNPSPTSNVTHKAENLVNFYRFTFCKIKHLQKFSILFLPSRRDKTFSKQKFVFQQFIYLESIIN